MVAPPVTHGGFQPTLLSNSTTKNAAFIDLFEESQLFLLIIVSLCLRDHTYKKEKKKTVHCEPPVSSRDMAAIVT